MLPCQSPILVLLAPWLRILPNLYFTLFPCLLSHQVHPKRSKSPTYFHFSYYYSNLTFMSFKSTNQKIFCNRIYLYAVAAFYTPTSQVTWHDVVDVSFADSSLAALRRLFLAKSPIGVLLMNKSWMVLAEISS